jgi:hypothetical protein
VSIFALFFNRNFRFRAKKAGWFMAESMRSSERESGLAFAFKIGEHSQMPKPPPDFPKDCGHFEAPPVCFQTSMYYSKSNYFSCRSTFEKQSIKQ